MKVKRVKKLKDKRIKAFKIIFIAYQRECTEYFLRSDTEEHVHKELKHLCETYYIQKKLKVLLPRKKENLLWHNRKKNLHKPPTDEQLEKVDANIKAGTKK